MSVSLKTLGLDQLSVDDRVELISELWDSLSSEADALPITDAQKSDLDHRLAATANAPLAGDPWEVVRSRIKGRE